jgi:hypothetical protein
MERIEDLSDDRLKLYCVYCELAVPDSDDHVPARILLDKPHPDNPPTIRVCTDCNASMALDEEYIACWIECARARTTDPAKLGRAKIARTLEQRPALRAMIEAARQPDDAPVAYLVDDARLRAFVLKLARGHAAFEISEKHRVAPAHLACGVMSLLSPEAAAEFDQPLPVTVWPEVGCRLLQRDCVVTAKLRSVKDGREQDVTFTMFDWIEVQPDRYRYLVNPFADGVVVRIVLSEFLACEVIWSDSMQKASTTGPT